MLENLDKSLKFCDQLSESEPCTGRGLTLKVSLIHILARKEENENFHEIEALQRVFKVGIHMFRFEFHFYFLLRTRDPTLSNLICLIEMTFGTVVKTKKNKKRFIHFSCVLFRLLKFWT